MALSNNGYQGWTILKEFNIDDGSLTGNKMPNIQTIAQEAIVPDAANITFNIYNDLTPTGGADGDIWYNLPADKLYKNIAGVWSLLSDRAINVNYAPPVQNLDACPLSSDVLPFSFAPLTKIQPSALTESNVIVNMGNTAPAAISISGGSEYNINGTGWTSAAGTILNGDSVKVRQTASASPNTTTTTVLTIGAETGNFAITTKQQVRINYSLSETQWCDGNVQLKANGVVLINVVGGGSTGTVYALEGDAITSEAYSVFPTLGTAPMLHHNIKKDGVDIYDNTITSDPPPQTSDVAAFTAVLGSIYDVEVDAACTGTPGYTLVNNTGHTVAYDIYDGGGSLTSSGSMIDRGVLDIQTLLSGGANSEIRLKAPVNGTYNHVNLMQGTTGTSGAKTTGQVFQDYLIADITTQLGLGYSGRQLLVV